MLKGLATFLGTVSLLFANYVGHGISIENNLKYKKDFTHFEYVNPNAPKGGTLKEYAIGTFDSFNPFITKGNPAASLSLLYDTLMVQSQDEAFSEYGLLAESIEVDKERKWVKFNIRKNAHFSDGVMIKAEDVKFSFELLINKASPQYKRYYADVAAVSVESEYVIRFDLANQNNAELPLILGQIPILPKHFWQDRDFSKSSLDAPLGSGPYTLESFKAGKQVVYKRNPKYWAKDLNVNKGQYNFERISIDYFRDQTVALEAFKAGVYDFRQETTSKLWATMYKGAKFEKGLIKKEQIIHEQPQGLQAFGFNLRNELFQDIRVRQAMALVYDFEWANKNLFFGQYKRMQSYFENSEYAAKELPSKAELAMLEPFKKELPKEVFTKVFHSPITKGDGRIRKQLRQAMKLLKQAGWIVKNKKLVHKETGKAFTFEILLVSPAFERVVLPFKKNLERLGMQVRVRLVDTSQYINRLTNFSYDMITVRYGQSSWPGNEQRYFWHSQSAEVKGSRNYMGIQNKAVDALVEKIVDVKNKQELIDTVRALDRVLLWNYYMIPQWYVNDYRVSYWNKFERPKISPKYGFGFYTWWIDTKKEKALEKELQK